MLADVFDCRSSPSGNIYRQPLALPREVSQRQIVNPSILGAVSIFDDQPKRGFHSEALEKIAVCWNRSLPEDRCSIPKEQARAAPWRGEASFFFAPTTTEEPIMPTLTTTEHGEIHVHHRQVTRMADRLWHLGSARAPYSLCR
jgi:hypothetical protein